jgi:type IV pilus assembly protein PilA
MTGQNRGFALIDLLFVCGMIGLLASISLPSLSQAKASAGSASAIGSMRAINSGELTFALSCGAGFYAPNLTTLGAVPAGSHDSFIGGGLGAADSVVKSAYLVQVGAVPFAGAPASCNGLAAGAAGQGYKAAADPLSPTNVRFFGTNANGVITEHTSSLFAVMPEAGDPPVGHPLGSTP